MMKNKKFSAVAALILALCMICGIFAACTPTVTKEPLESLTLDKTTVSLYVGDSVSLTATPSRNLYEDEVIEWSSDKTDIATVTQRGAVRAVAGGTAVITAKVGDISASCTVTVNTRTITIEAPDSLTLELLDETKNTLKLSATSSDGSPVTWSSGDTAIATVDSNGNVKAAGKGEVKIYAKVGATESFVTVTVNAPADYYMLERVNNLTACNAPGKWHWFTQGASVYTLIGSPYHADGKAVISFSDINQVPSTEANKSEYYFRYQPEFEVGSTYTFTCKIKSTISGKIEIGVEQTDFAPVSYDLIAGEKMAITVQNVIVNDTTPLYIRFYMEGATAENPLTVEVYDYNFAQ